MEETGKISHASAAVQRLTNEVFVDTLRYISRKELIRKIYLVNRRFMSLADTYVPNLYVSSGALNIEYSPESHIVRIYPGGRREPRPEIFPETLELEITGIPRDADIPLDKDFELEFPEEGHQLINPFPWYLRREVIQKLTKETLAYIGKGYDVHSGIKYPDIKYPEEDYAMKEPFPWYFRFCEVRVTNMCDPKSKFWSFIESQLKSTFPGCYLKHNFENYDNDDADPKPKQYYIDYYSSRIFPLFPNCSKYFLNNLELTQSNSEDENRSWILSMPSLFNCDNIGWRAGNSSTTSNSLCGALEIISWLHHSNESIQRQRNLLIYEWSTNLNTIHEIVKAAKELFFTDNKGSVNFSIAYHYNCKKQNKKVEWFEEEGEWFDVSDKYDPHADFENWPEVFCITNESARQKLLFNKSVSKKSIKNRECYVLQRIALD
ncbi:hypothetical protein Ddc_11043 [Ditylenchus destructor]|nr:hypothetical protein Ddc_11043 [Ditylenchus destructor]